MRLPGRNNRRLLALSFDDGPAELTLDLLDLLGRFDARATFFVLGREIGTREHVVARAAAEGHEIGNHTFSHRRVPEMTQTELEQELRDTSDLVERAAGTRTRLFRPPYGFAGLAAYPVARKLGLIIVRWTTIVKDWDGAGPDEIVRAALEASAPGAVIVMHDGGGDRRATLLAVEEILPELLNQGYELVTISELLQASAQTRHQVVIRPYSAPRRLAGRIRRRLTR
jgi:peptidoglycan/xylan/chitin deacetylase (PgdA/CDA1 family)